MIRRLVATGLSVALIALVVIDIALLASVILSRRDLRVARGHYAGGLAVSRLQLVGFDRGGRRLDITGGAAGLAVRYASKNCPFSIRDVGWEALGPTLLTRGLQIAVLTPLAELGFSKTALVPTGALQAAFINADWVNQYRLTLTPTLLVFDAEGNLIWHREGTLTQADVRAAIRAVDRALLTRLR